MFHDWLDSMVLFKRSPKMPLFWFQDNLGSRPWISGNYFRQDERIPGFRQHTLQCQGDERHLGDDLKRGFSDGPWIGLAVSQVDTHSLS